MGCEERVFDARIARRDAARAEEVKVAPPVVKKAKVEEVKLEVKPKKGGPKKK